MSSSTSRFVEIPINHAETGDTYILHLPSNASVDDMRKQVEQYADILPNHMILLYGPPFIRLDPKRTLAYYGFIGGENTEKKDQEMVQEKKEVFLFCRTTLTQKNTVFLDVILEPQTIRFPKTPSDVPHLTPRVLPGNPFPFLKAICEYEYQLTFHVEQATALMEGAQQRLDSCTICLGQCNVHVRSVKAAILNMDDHCRQIRTVFERFISDCNKQQAKHHEVLSSFDADLEKLKEIVLPQSIYLALVSSKRKTSLEKSLSSSSSSSTSSPSFTATVAATANNTNNNNINNNVININASQSGVGTPPPAQSLFVNTETTLYDIVPVKKLLQWNQEAKRHVELVQEKVSELSKLDESIRESAAESSSLGGDSLHNDYKLDERENRCRELFDSQREALQEIKMHFNSARSSINMALQGSTADIEIIPKLETLMKTHVEIVEKMLKTDSLLLQEMDLIGQIKAKVSKLLTERLQNISSIQSKIRDLGNKIEALKEGLSVQRSLIMQLDVVRHMPEAYSASIKEISRRQEFGRTYNSNIQKVADAIAHLREQEVTKREFFSRKYGRYLPSGLSTILLQNYTIPRCTISQKGFDEHLPVLGEDVITTAAMQTNEDGKTFLSSSSMTTSNDPQMIISMPERRLSLTNEGMMTNNNNMSSNNSRNTMVNNTDDDVLVDEEDLVSTLRIENLALKGQVPEALQLQKKQLMEEHSQAIARYEARIAELEAALQKKSSM